MFLLNILYRCKVFSLFIIGYFSLFLVNYPLRAESLIVFKNQVKKEIRKQNLYDSRIISSSLAKKKKNKSYHSHELFLLKEATSPQKINVFNKTNAIDAPSSSVGILFTYKYNENVRIDISGSFSNWQRTPMHRGKNGVYFLYYPINQEMMPLDLDSNVTEIQIRYRFFINGYWTHDPTHSSREISSIKENVSIYSFPLEKKELHKISYRIIEKIPNEKNANSQYYLIQFQIFNPSAQRIALVGEFNQWDVESDILNKNSNNIFSTTLLLQSGNYLYHYFIDGNWKLDLNNVETRYHTGREKSYSYLQLP